MARLNTMAKGQDLAQLFPDLNDQRQQQETRKRVDAFLAELNVLQQKHGLQLVPRAEIGITEIPKGALIPPKTDEELARKHIIDQNTAAGRDTKLEELQ